MREVDEEEEKVLLVRRESEREGMGRVSIVFVVVFVSCRRESKKSRPFQVVFVRSVGVEGTTDSRKR